jgi:hypothetical protein
MNNLYPIVLLLFFSACSLSTSKTKGGEGPRVLVLNQGGFNKGEATLTEIRPESGVVTVDVFMDRNGRPLGDIAQSLMPYGDRYYIVVNNSQKIEVVAKSDYRTVATIAIPDNAGPRHIAETAGGFAYVTALYSDRLYKVNLSSNTVTGTVAIGSGTEGIAVRNDTAFVAMNLNADFSSGNQIALVRTSSDQVITTWETGTGPVQIEVVGPYVVVTCSGTWGRNDGEIVVHNRTTGAIVRRIALGTYASTFALGSGTVVYALGNGIVRADVATGSTVTLSMRSAYAIGFDGDRIWIADPLNYAQAGIVYRLSVVGTVQDSFRVGIIPGSFHFDGD